MCPRRAIVNLLQLASTQCGGGSVCVSIEPYVIYNVPIITEKKYGRHSLVIPVDFSGGLEIYDAISEQLKDLSIGVLGM